jgi:hypothetical protein
LPLLIASLCLVRLTSKSCNVQFFKLFAHADEAGPESVPEITRQGHQVEIIVFYETLTDIKSPQPKACGDFLLCEWVCA